MRGRELWLNFDSSAGRGACRRRSCRKGVKRTPICCSSCTRAKHFYSRLVETLHLGTRCIMYPSLFAIVTIAQCAFWVLRWPCGQKLKSKNTLSDGKKIFLRPFFLCCFRKKTLKLVSLFIFRH